MTVALLLRLDLAATVLLLAWITALPAAAALLCWAAPARRPRPRTVRAALLAAGSATSPSRRQLPATLAVHHRGFAARRRGLRRLALLLAAPSTAAILAAGRLLGWHVTVATPAAVATVTRRSRRTWVLTNFARHPADQHRGAGATLLRQILTAAAAAGADVQLTASTRSLLDYYQRHGFESAAGARSSRRLICHPRTAPTAAPRSSSHIAHDHLA